MYGISGAQTWAPPLEFDSEFLKYPVWLLESLELISSLVGGDGDYQGSPKSTGNISL